MLVGLLLFSGWSVYTRYVDLHNFDLVTNMPFRDLSMSQYNDTLAGVRTFPYQWRVLAFWMARAGTMIAPVDPHLIDVAIKTLALAASAALLYMFSTTLVSALGAVLAAVHVSVRDRRGVRLRRLRDLFHQRLPGDPLVVRRCRRVAARTVVARRARRVRGRVGQGNRDADRVPRRLRSAAQARAVVGGDRMRRRLRDPDADPPDDLSRAARAVGVVGHVQAERALHRVAGRRSSPRRFATT